MLSWGKLSKDPIGSEMDMNLQLPTTFSIGVHRNHRVDQSSLLSSPKPQERDASHAEAASAALLPPWYDCKRKLLLYSLNLGIGFRRLTEIGVGYSLAVDIKRRRLVVSCKNDAIPND